MQPTHALRKIHPYPPVIHQHILHLEIRPLGIVLLVKLYERILQRIARLLVFDHFAGQDLTEARKDELQIIAAGDRVELAYEQDVFGRTDFGKRQIADHFKREGGGIRVGVASYFFGSRGIERGGEIFVVG